MAINMVGCCFEKGWGVAEDRAEAERWYARAAEGGLDWGMYNFGSALALGTDAEQDADSLIATSQVVAVNFQTIAAANNYWR